MSKPLRQCSTCPHQFYGYGAQCSACRDRAHITRHGYHGDRGHDVVQERRGHGFEPSHGQMVRWVGQYDGDGKLVNPIPEQGD